jgi:hypothetical protein
VLLVKLFIDKIIVSVNKNSLTYFPIYMPFISFSCLIVLDNICSTILSRNDKSRHPCLVLDLTGEAVKAGSDGLPL